MSATTTRARLDGAVTGRREIEVKEDEDDVAAPAQVLRCPTGAAIQNAGSDIDGDSDDDMVQAVAGV